MSARSLPFLLQAFCNGCNGSSRRKDGARVAEVCTDQKVGADREEQHGKQSLRETYEMTFNQLGLIARTLSHSEAPSTNHGTNAMRAL